MKLALVCFDFNKSSIGGASSFNTFLPDLFASLGEIRFIFASENGNQPDFNKRVYDAKDLRFTDYIKFSQLSDFLNTFDWAYFITPGFMSAENKKFAKLFQQKYQKNVYTDYILKGLKTPFITGILGEEYWFNESIFDFCNHNTYQGLFLHHRDILKTKPNDLNIKKYVEIGQIVNPRWFVSQELKPLKQNILVCHSRWNSVKRVGLLMEYTPDINKLGLDVHFYGCHGNGGYKSDLIKRYPQNTGRHYHPVFSSKDTENFLRPALFHYNIKFRPDINAPYMELATIEAARLGCICIVHEQHTPHWFTECVKLRSLEKSYVLNSIQLALNNPPNVLQAWQSISNNISPKIVLNKICQLFS